MGEVAEPQDFSVELFEGNSTLVPSPFMTQVLDHLGAHKKECFVSNSFQEMVVSLFKALSRLMRRLRAFV